MENELFYRYGEAFLSLAKEKDRTIEYREDIKFLQALFKKNNNFSLLLTSFEIEKEDKYKIIDSVLESFPEDCKDFLKTIVLNDRAYYIDKILDKTITCFNDFLKIEYGTLYISPKIDKKQIEKIIKSTSEKINRIIEYNVEVDESLIGGFKLVLSNQIFDASIKTNLNNLKTKIIKGE